ncbi:MAG: hypothetical protein KGO47_01440 [Cyanobacteria bacterium REEB417]|nr:hypothetical protein [Cyanobacteria bacterium REEB417]
MEFLRSFQTFYAPVLSLVTGCAMFSFALMLSMSATAPAWAAKAVQQIPQELPETLLACGGGGNGAERKPARPGTTKHQ